MTERFRWLKYIWFLGDNISRRKKVMEKTLKLQCKCLQIINNQHSPNTMLKRLLAQENITDSGTKTMKSTHLQAVNRRFSSTEGDQSTRLALYWTLHIKTGETDFLLWPYWGTVQGRLQAKLSLTLAELSLITSRPPMHLLYSARLYWTVVFLFYKNLTSTLFILKFFKVSNLTLVRW